MIQFQEYLQSEYPGFASFIDTIIKPIFGDGFKANKNIDDMIDCLDNDPEELENYNEINKSTDDNIKILAAESGLERVLNLGAIHVSGDTRPIYVYDITVSNRRQLSRNRKGIQQLITRTLNNQSGAFMLFHYNDANWEWRFSYKFVGKDKEDTTDSKRYTYLLGKDQVCKTAAQRFTNLLNKKGRIAFEDIKEAFSVEKVSKEFFDHYRGIYADIICYVTGKRMVKSGGKWEEKQEHEPNEFIMEQFAQFADPEKSVRDYVKKLMGRLVFLQFIQKKGWLGVPTDDASWTQGDKEFIQHLFNRCENKDTFIDDVLEPLFKDINNRREGDVANSVLGAGIKIPYLNGGLFEKDAEDDTQFPLPAHFMDEMLNQFFSAYNFTIDENDPSDAEVGVDPEMLGRVFENLLEDNKDKGAFYTPKEIVQYMCRESLIAYLQTDIENDAVKQSFRDFVTTHEVSALNPADVFKVDKKLREVKICDPAIGSGAFPMGLLKELFDCRMAVEGEEEGKTPAEIKKDIIQNSIYGVDIEKGAVDIARLRFWLSLIIDEQTPHALPNMDFKIMQGNSLLEQYKGVRLDNIYSNSGQMELAFDEETAARMLFLEHIYKYFKEDDHDKKNELLVLIDNAVKSLVKAKTLGNEEIAESIDSLDLRNNTDFFLWHTWFNDVFQNGGFDIVIGNPPYFVYEGKNKGEIATLKKIKDFKIAMGGKLNAYKLFLAHALNCLVKKSGINCFIFQNSFMADLQAAKLREHALSNCQILSIDSFPERDSKKKRVFESVKMSVCIVLIRNIKDKAPFIVNIWDDRDKTSGTNTSFSKSEIDAIDKEGHTIPRISEELKPIIIKMLKHKKVNIKCNEGELNVTSHRKYFSTDKCLPIIMKGAGIQRYYHTFNMSQGSIEYLMEDDYLRDLGSSEKAQHHCSKRIVMQGMTGANDKIRLVMTIIPEGMYLGHSCKYIMPIDELQLECILAIMNSKIANVFFRCFSTNSNVNGYEVENIPIPKIPKEMQAVLTEKVSYILSAKHKNICSDTTAEEREIDRLVYDLYGLTPEEIAIVEGTK